MAWQRWINDDRGNQEEIDPITHNPTAGQDRDQNDQGNHTTELGDWAENRPIDPDWVREGEDWAREHWDKQGGY